MLETRVGAGKRWAVHLGLAGLGLFAFGALQFPAVANLGLGLALLGLLLDGRASARWLAREPLVGLLLLFALALAAGLALAWPVAHRAEDLDAAGRLLKLWLFLPLAYWLGGRERRILAFLGVAAAGFLLGRLAALDWLAPPALVTGERIRLGISSINHFALYAATASIGLACFTPRVLRALAALAPAARRVGIALWAAALALTLYWTIAAQSRGVWLGAVATAAVLVVLLGWVRGRRALVVGLASAAVIAAVLGLAAGALVAQRLEVELATVGQALSGRWGELPYDSTGTRLHMIGFGLERWREAPWLGHGPGGLTTVLQQTGGELAVYKHLHNVFVDGLARLGIVGTVLLQGLFVGVLVAAWRAFRAGALAVDVALFALGGLLLAFLANLTDLRLFGWDWRNYWLLLASVGYAVPMRGSARSSAS